MRRLWKHYSLSLVLAILFALSWIGQLYFQWAEFREDQLAHNQPVAVVEFVPPFLAATFENWQSEFLQLLTFVVLTSFLVHRGSHESKDSDERMHRALDRIERRLDELATRD
jgi:hypothetical protein